MYRLFSSKLGILKALLDVSIVGDDEALSLQERPQVAVALRRSRPREAPGRVRRHHRRNQLEERAVYRILSSAAGSDPAAAALLADYPHSETRPRPDRTLAGTRRALRPELRERDAADIIHALMSPEVYRLLVIDRGWPPERYEQWLARILADQLISPVPRSPRTARR